MVSVEPWNKQDKRPTKESTPKVLIVSIMSPRAPLPDKGFIRAVGRASTKLVSRPHVDIHHLMLLMSISIAPEDRNTPIPTRMATK